MKYILIILLVCVVITIGQVSWTSRARVRHHTEFFRDVTQETVYELERRGFSSLTLTNITQNVSQALYSWHVNGTANYTNGFLVSIQKIDVTAMTQMVGIPTVDGVPTPTATVRGTLNLRDVKLGYDVIFYELNGTMHRYTADYGFSLISWAISIQKVLATDVIMVTLSADTTGGNARMVFSPATNLTEVFTRGFAASQHGPGVSSWATTLEPIVLDVVKNKVPFPGVCFSHCDRH